MLLRSVFRALSKHLTCSSQRDYLTRRFEYLETIGTSAKFSVGEDCEERLLTHMASDIDDAYRFDGQCHSTCQCHAFFKTPCCSGVYLVNGMSSLVPRIVTHSALDIWR